MLVSSIGDFDAKERAARISSSIGRSIQQGRIKAQQRGCILCASCAGPRGRCACW
jgi:hypothetical protein